jgi:hypothetical protein
VQLALQANSSGPDVRSGWSSSAGRVNKLLLAAVAVTGAATIAVNPTAQTVAADVQHKAAAAIEQRAVRLTSGIGDVVSDYESVFNQAGANLQTLAGEAQVALPALVQSLGADLSGIATGVQTGANPQTVAAAVAALPGLLQSIGAGVPGYGSLIGTGLSGAATSLQNALNGGWYGGDDGFVFGLFGGTVTANGVTESGSTLQEIIGALQQGNAFNAFSYGEEWALEVIDHTLKPLLSPFLNTAKVGATPSATIPGEILQALTNAAATLPTPIPAELLQSLTNVTATFLSYPQLKALGDAILAPALSVGFGLIGGLSTIAADASSGNLAQALTDVLKTPADLAGDLLNGYVFPNATTNPTGLPFTGLLNAGSLIEDVLSTWPKELAAALTLTPVTTTATTTTAAATTTTTAAATTTASTLAAKDVTAKTADATSATAADATDDTSTAKDTKTRHRFGPRSAATAGSADSSARSTDANASTRHRAAGHGDAGSSSSAHSKDAGSASSASRGDRTHDGDGHGGAGHSRGAHSGAS